MIADAISRAETLNNKEVLIDYLIRDIKYGSCFFIFTKHIKVQSIFDPMALSRLSPCYLKCICFPNHGLSWCFKNDTYL